MIIDPPPTGVGNTNIRSDIMAIKKISIDVLGMTCAACSSRVEKTLNKQDGVQVATVNLLSNKATVEFDADQTTEQEIIKAIQKSGYEVPLVSKTVLIEGMTCAACSTRVDKALNKVEGVVKANVNLSTNKATIQYPSGLLKDEDLVNIIEKAGYKSEV